MRENFASAEEIKDLIFIPRHPRSVALANVDTSMYLRQDSEFRKLRDEKSGYLVSLQNYLDFYKVNISFTM